MTGTGQWLSAWSFGAAKLFLSGRAGCRVGARGRGWKLSGGDLEAVEEKSGALGIDLVGGEALDDLVEGGLQAGGVGGDGDVEAATGAALIGVGNGAAGGVVVVAKALAAEGGRAAAVVVGEDVGAGDGWLAHDDGYPSPGYLFSGKY
jgi:hypothetical protein